MFRKQNEGKPLCGRILIISKYFHINKEAGLINSSLLLLLYFLLLVAVPLFAILSIHSKIVSSSSKNSGAVAISQTECKYLRPYFQIIESFKQKDSPQGKPKVYFRIVLTQFGSLYNLWDSLSMVSIYDRTAHIDSPYCRHQ